MTFVTRKLRPANRDMIIKVLRVTRDIRAIRAIRVIRFIRIIRVIRVTMIIRITRIIIELLGFCEMERSYQRVLLFDSFSFTV